jgi:hypothetical protein
MKKKISRQVDKFVEELAREYEEACYSLFEQFVDRIADKCDIDEDEARNRLGELV